MTDHNTHAVDPAAEAAPLAADVAPTEKVILDRLLAIRDALGPTHTLKPLPHGQFIERALRPYTTEEERLLDQLAEAAIDRSPLTAEEEAWGAQVAARIGGGA